MPAPPDEVLIATGLQAPAGPLAGAPFAALHFCLAAGAALSLRGASGAGKSTVLAMAAALVACAPGQLALWGRDVASLAPAEAARLRQDRLGILRQGPNLVPTLSVADNVVLQARLAGIAPDPRRLEGALQALDLQALAKRRASRLSGGEAARAGLARIVYQAPALVLADEPSAGQDAARARAVTQALLALRAGGSAILLATHDAALADALGPSVWLAPKGLP